MSDLGSHDGLYELLVTNDLHDQLRRVADRDVETGHVDQADQPHVLARHVYQAAVRSLEAVKDPELRVKAANELIAQLETGDADHIVTPPTELRRITSPQAPGTVTYLNTRPKTPLTEAALLTNSKEEPSLAAELRAEIDTSDEVDLLCAFVRWYGLRLVEPELRRLRDRGGRLRVITTTYTGSTERDALDRLVRDFGAQVKVQYDAQRTRLHAKAWMFRRNTEFDTAYVGSSNLTRTAMVEGVEWNVRLSRKGTPSLFDKFTATFDTYWNHGDFELYDPDRDRDRLDDALAEASGRSRGDRVTISLSGLEVRPYPYQQKMLDDLDAERTLHDRHHNLVVAATGTGKTVVAALDYRRLTENNADGKRPKLLFVAHRKEILQQSLRTYREVLSDATFGELYVDGARPERWEHVFASVQSLKSYGVSQIPSEAYDIVVIDEFHHAEAKSYRELIDHLRPAELIGLTATPERADGVNVASFFDNRIATQLRLWDALGADLLCPFHYFAVSDNTDLRAVKWVRGKYDDTALSSLYTGNDARARIILNELRDKMPNVSQMRALGFCVDVAHANYMADVFNQAGIPAGVVTGITASAVRRDSIAALRERRLNVLFSVDVFNEGLDIPDVDTVLFLRPTDSATVFLQQLGRGLRRTRDKAVLTVLDFVGHQNKQFSWDRKLRAMTGLTRAALRREVERGFPFLPAGCQIVMDREAQALIVDNLKSQISNRWPSMVQELRSYGDLSLSEYLNESGMELPDVLRKGQHSWTELRRLAGLPVPDGTSAEARLLRRVRAFSHVDDPLRAATFSRLLADDAPSYSTLSSGEQRLADMLFFSLWPDGGGFDSIDAGFRALRAEQATRSEIKAVVDLAFDSARHRLSDLSGPLSKVPLMVHARYQREEILAALGYASLDRKPNSMREGVKHIPELNVDAFFINLKKSEADFSPTTMYRDYPISPTLFHWETQSTTSVTSKTGQRYLTGASNVLLFAREQADGIFGTSPYLFLGPATYVSHTGDRPIAITWRLDHAMPTDFFSAASVAAS
ncbi:putative helicase [Nocardioidaceae bacterium Broad-1]|nr:putative helicase [Nocardioidaceae bacterium Broad-1]